MGINLYREYLIKFYLNASHYIIINGNKGSVHPHTWEFSLTIRFGRSGFVEFRTFEKGIEAYLAKYQNKIMNEEEPFDAILPTLENMTDYFAEPFCKIIHDIGGILVKLEASETPTRSYILNLPEEGIAGAPNADVEADAVSHVMDAILDDIVR